MAHSPLEVATFAHPHGTLPCRHSGCGNGNAVSCHYTDASGHRCRTAWCPDHWRTVGGVVYCRRHANTVIALGGDPLDSLGLPDLDNRGPSLVNWVYRDIDTSMRRAIESLDRHAGVTARDASVTVVIKPGGLRQWERGWTLRTGDETRHRVVVGVADADDALVLLYVDGSLLAQGVPPWIERHRRDVLVTAAVDAAQRRLFYSFLVDHVARVMAPFADATAV